MEFEKPVNEQLRKALEDSVVVKRSAQLHADQGFSIVFGDSELRDLTMSEVEQLVRNGNWSSDWNRIRIPTAGFDPDRIRFSSFEGDVAFGSFAAGSAHISHPTGIYRSTISNSFVGSECLIADVSLLESHAVGPSTTMINCGSISHTSGGSFGIGTEISIGLEGGGREVRLFPELTVSLASTIARFSLNCNERDEFNDIMDEIVLRSSQARGFIGSHSLIRNVGRLEESFVDSYSSIDGASELLRCVILSTEDEPTRIGAGLIVRDSMIQWNCELSGHAIVERSLLCEATTVGQHAKVIQSVIGSDCTVAKGEITASLVGPFVGFNHQSLLIAVLWPEGRGNIAYGANVGSNHTSKAPDQECRPGEGLFVGLGANIKYPTNLTESPYSLISTSVSTLPQRVRFPFSLINSPTEPIPGVPPAFNEIIPGWMLSDNLYALLRNEAKFRTRRRASREQIDIAIFRPQIIDWMHDAAIRLQNPLRLGETYTEKEIPGLGKNFLHDRQRLRAIETYDYFMKYYCLMGILDVTPTPAELGSPLSGPIDALWNHQQRLLTEYFQLSDVRLGLHELSSMVTHIAELVERSKAKDDHRGRKIFDDYESVRKPTKELSFVIASWKRAEQLSMKIQEMLKSM